jgi:hypothetical protein
MLPTAEQQAEIARRMNEGQRQAEVQQVQAAMSMAMNDGGVGTRRGGGRGRVRGMSGMPSMSNLGGGRDSMGGGSTGMSRGGSEYRSRGMGGGGMGGFGSQGDMGGFGGSGGSGGGMSRGGRE